MKSIFSLFLFFLLIHRIPAQKEIQVTDLTRIQSISGVSYSPDGSQIVFTVQSIHPDPKDKLEFTYTTQLWLSDAEGQIARPITFHRDGASSPAWSPDNTQIAFVRPVDSKPQVFILSLNGGEAWQLTSEKNGASNPVWSPDGQSIVYSSSYSLNDLISDTVINPTKIMPDWPMEKAGFKDNNLLKSNPAKPDPNGSLDEVRAYLALNEKDRKAKVITKLQFQLESTVTNEMNFNLLFIISSKPESKAKSLTTGYYSYNNPQFIGTSGQLLIQSDLNPLEHPDRSLESEVYALDTATKSLHKILGKKGMAYNQIRVSPGGKWIAFTQSQINKVGIPALGLLPGDGSEKDIKWIPHDRNINAMVFSPDESTLFMTSPSNGGVVLYKIDLANLNVVAMSSFDEGIGSFDLSGDQIAFVKTSIASPFELFVADYTLQNARPITSLNSSWLSGKDLSKPEKFTFKNEQGMTVEYWVMKPTRFEAGKKYPTILNIHGGPTAMWGPGESTMWHEFQYYCAKGYGVVYCNPRGSGGYGQAFMRANINDWGKGPTSDVLKSLDGAVAQGWIDTSKLAVTGGSYAGYLVAWIISHDHRFKAACSQRGVYDLTTFFGEGNAWRLVPNYFGGYPWEAEAQKNLERESPINYVKAIQTPYLIFHGEQDLRTGVIQSEQLYKSLKVLGKTVEYVRHPGATHELTRSGNNRQRIDQMLRTWEFFDRFIHKKV